MMMDSDISVNGKGLTPLQPRPALLYGFGYRTVLECQSQRVRSLPTLVDLRERSGSGARRTSGSEPDIRLGTI